MMAAKLEWVRDANGWWHAPRSCGAKGGYWSVAVNNDGMFLIAGETEKRWHTLSDAKDYCQAQEDMAAPPAELPKPGYVYEVPGKRETRRMFGGLDHDGEFVKWYGPHNRGVESVEQWQSWLTSTGAVRIDDGGKHDAQWRREELAKFTDLLEYAKSELDAERARVAALEAEVARLQTQLRTERGGADTACRQLENGIEGLEAENESLRKRWEEAAQERDDLRAKLAKLQSEHEAVQAERNRLREWKASVSNAIQNIPEFAAGQWGGDKDGWGYHFEVVQYLIRNRDELRTKVGLMEEEAKAGRGTPLKGAAYVRVGRAAGRAEMRERAETAEKERDDARAECARLRGDALAASTAKQESEAARGRLLEALRGIEGTTIYCRDNPLVKLAREARLREEEGVKS